MRLVIEKEQKQAVIGIKGCVEEKLYAFYPHETLPEDYNEGFIVYLTKKEHPDRYHWVILGDMDEWDTHSFDTLEGALKDDYKKFNVYQFDDFKSLLKWANKVIE